MTKPYKLFIDAIKRNDIESAKVLYRSHTIDVRANKNFAFNYACAENCTHIVTWIYSLGRIDVGCAFEGACRAGNLFVAQLLYSLEKEKGRICMNNGAFIIACANGHLEIIQWMYLLEGEKIDVNHALIIACRNGHLDIARWIHSLDMHTAGASLVAFNEACKNGHLDLAKWFAQHINIDSCDYYTFCSVCSNNYLEMAQWMYSWGKVSIELANEAFQCACSNGHVDMVLWLHSQGNINIHAQSERAFRKACANNHLSIAQWLYSQDGVDIHVDDPWRKGQYNCAFRWACTGGHIEIVKWLYSLGGMDNECFSKFLADIRRGDIAMLKFFLENGANIHVRSNDLFVRLGKWKNKVAAFSALIQYCSEDDYVLIDARILGLILNRTKSARCI